MSWTKDDLTNGWAACRRYRQPRSSAWKRRWRVRIRRPRSRVSWTPRGCRNARTARPVRYGRASDLQRYKCHVCRPTFNVLTGTPLARLRQRWAWRVFAQALMDGETVRASAARAGVKKTPLFAGATGFWRRRRRCKPND